MGARLDLDELNVAMAVGTDLLAEPVVAKGVVLGSRSHAGRFELGEGKGAGVVFVDADVDVGGVRGEEAEDGGDLFKLVDDGEQVLASRAEGDVFGFHG